MAQDAEITKERQTSVVGQIKAAAKNSNPAGFNQQKLLKPNKRVARLVERHLFKMLLMLHIVAVQDVAPLNTRQDDHFAK